MTHGVMDLFLITHTPYFFLYRALFVLKLEAVRVSAYLTWTGEGLKRMEPHCRSQPRRPHLRSQNHPVTQGLCQPVET